MGKNKTVRLIRLDSGFFQRIKDRPQAPGKPLTLFSEEEVHRNDRYSANSAQQKKKGMV